MELNENIKYILSDDIKIYKHKNIYFTHRGDKFEIDGLKRILYFWVNRFRVFFFYINADNKNIFHSKEIYIFGVGRWYCPRRKRDESCLFKTNLWNSKVRQYRYSFCTSKDPRLGVNTFEGVKIFNEKLKPKIIVPMHFSDDYSIMENLKKKFLGQMCINRGYNECINGVKMLRVKYYKLLEQ